MFDIEKESNKKYEVQNKIINFISSLKEKIYKRINISEGDILYLKSGKILYVHLVISKSVYVYDKEKNDFYYIDKCEIKKLLKNIIGNQHKDPHLGINISGEITSNEFIRKYENVSINTKFILDRLDNKKQLLSFSEFSNIAKTHYFSYDIRYFDELLNACDFEDKYILVKFSDGYRFIDITSNYFYNSTNF